MSNVTPPTSRCLFAIERCEITPPVGTYHRMWGAASHDVSEGVHRELTMTVAAFANPAVEPQERTSSDIQLLILLDHCILGPQEIQLFRDRIEATTGYGKDAVLVLFSHTHAAGLMGLDRVNQPGGEGIPDYLQSIAMQAGDLVAHVLKSLRPATLVYGLGKCQLAAQRDYWDEETQQFVCGYNPHAEADDHVLCSAVYDDQDQALIATFTNYACHPTTLAWDNKLISPDFPGAMRETIEAHTQAISCFIQGASGDLGPVEGYVGDVEVADRNGRQLGFAALSTLTSLPAPNTKFVYQGPVISGATLGTWGYEPLTSSEQVARTAWKTKRMHIPIAYRSTIPTPEQLEQEMSALLSEETRERAAGNHDAAGDLRAQAERKRRNLARLAALPEGDKFPYEVVIWRMGDVVWVAVQGEPYQQLQLELRRRNPSVTIMVAGLANSWGPSYLPPRQLYDRGLYQESIAILEPGCLEQVIDAVSTEIEAIAK